MSQGVKGEAPGRTCFYRLESRIFLWAASLTEARSGGDWSPGTLAVFPFNKSGMLSGHVEYVSPDAAKLPDTRERVRKTQEVGTHFFA